MAEENLKETTEDALRRIARKNLQLEEDNGRLKRQIESLKEEAKLYDEFIVKCTEVIPEGFDDDVAAEAVVLNYLNEMNSFAGTIARLTSAYR